MINTLLGTKKNMTSTYDSRGRRVGATIIEMVPNLVTQVKSQETKDGYSAVQLGYGIKKSVNKPQLGHVKKVGSEAKVRWFREARTEGVSEDVKPGTEIKLDQVFSTGDIVKVTGVSKGKGFQGGVRRHGFHGGSRTHGQSDRMRAPGSIGSGTTPGRVYKGKRMAGHMGNVTSSVKNLEIVKLDKKNNLLIVKGGVPGHIGTLLTITNLGRVKGYTPPPEEKIEDEDVDQTTKSEEGAEFQVQEPSAATAPVVEELTQVTEEVGDQVVETKTEEVTDAK